MRVQDEDEAREEGWLWVQPCSEKFEVPYDFLFDLDEYARRATWDFPEEDESSEAEGRRRRRRRPRRDGSRGPPSQHDPESPEAEPENPPSEENPLPEPDPRDGHWVRLFLDFIYAGSYTWTGKLIRDLFEDCANDGAPADDPRVAELRDLIRQERATVKEEQRLYEIGLERAIADPLSESDPVLQPFSKVWRDMTNHESAFDRQIATKLRLLMKLQSDASERSVDEEETLDVPETSPPENGSGPDPDDSGSPPDFSSEDPAATSPNNPEEEIALRVPTRSCRCAGTTMR
jgi:hypothetical protein